MAWNVYRRGRHLSIQLPVEVKNQLVRNKARGGGTLTEQIISALQSKWSGAAPAVVQPQNSVPPQRLAPSARGAPQSNLAPGTIIYNGQVYKVQRPPLSTCKKFHCNQLICLLTAYISSSLGGERLLPL
jgi:hypothetical protein